MVTNVTIVNHLMTIFSSNRIPSDGTDLCVFKLFTGPYSATSLEYFATEVCQYFLGRNVGKLSPSLYRILSELTKLENNDIYHIQNLTGKCPYNQNYHTLIK